MVGQMQMLFLIFLTRSATSEDVREVVRRSDFTMNIFYYISLSKINFYDKIYSNIDFQLSTPSLADVGLKSDKRFIIIEININLRGRIRSKWVWYVSNMHFNNFWFD